MLDHTIKVGQVGIELILCSVFLKSMSMNASINFMICYVL